MITTSTRTREHSDTSELSGHPNRPTRERRLARLLATGFATVAAFELALAAGAPWGAAAWGGADPGRLSSELRVASSLAACFWALACLTALSRGGVAASSIPSGLSRRAVWALTALLTAGAVMNAASPSSWERFGWAPFILGLAVLSFQLARCGRPDSGDRRCAGAIRRPVGARGLDAGS